MIFDDRHESSLSFTHPRHILEPYTYIHVLFSFSFFLYGDPVNTQQFTGYTFQIADRIDIADSVVRASIFTIKNAEPNEVQQEATLTIKGLIPGHLQQRASFTVYLRSTGADKRRWNVTNKKRSKSFLKPAIGFYWCTPGEHRCGCPVRKLHPITGSGGGKKKKP